MSYVPPPVPERWDKGKWDQAHWNGQLGLQAAPGNVVISGADARLLLIRGIRPDPLNVTVIGNDAVLFAALSYPFPVETGEIVVSGGDTTIVAAHYLMRAEPATAIVVDGKVASLVPGDTMPMPGMITYGIGHVTIPRHW